MKDFSIPKRLTSGLFAILALFSSLPAFAQIQDENDYQRLVWRFDQLQKAKTPEGTDLAQKGINTEREAIRSEIEKDLNSFLKTEENFESVDLVRIMDKQRSLVESLIGLVDGTKADLSELEKEERYYKQFQETGTGTELPIMITKSYPELLARKAVLEERLIALQAFEKNQEDRLNKLKMEQQVRSLGLLLNILTYIGLFLIVFWAERIIRNSFLVHIRHRRLRYSITKAFTFVVYVSLSFWLIEKLFSEYPSIITIIAVIGGALIFIMQDFIKSAVGWLGLRNSMNLGQRVTIGTMTGDVIDIGILYTTLLISRTMNMEYVEQVGKIVRVPNAKLLSENVVNYHSTSDFENVEFAVLIARFDQWEQANRIVEDIVKKETDAFAQKAQRQTDLRMRGFYHAHVSPSWRVYMEITKEHEVEFIVCFPAPIGQRRAIATQILKEILHRFTEAGIAMSPGSEGKKEVE